LYDLPIFKLLNGQGAWTKLESFPANRIVVIFDKKRSWGTDMIKKMRRFFA